MEEIIEVAIEAGLGVAEAAADSKNKGGCIFLAIIFVAIAVGVTLYFVYQ